MGGTALAGGLRLLATPGVRGAFVARICGTLAWQMLAVVVGWQVYAITHDVLALGLVGLCDFLAFVAFALPGGYVYITRGLLAYLNSEAEMAAVLGHEIGHVTARHSVRQISGTRAAQIGYSIGSIFVPELRSQVGQGLFNVLGGAITSGYGREHELEAIGKVADALAARDLPHDSADVAPFVESLHRYLARTPAKLLGVSVTDLVGDRRAINQPGTDTEYPNWKLPLTGPAGELVTMEMLTRGPGPRRITRWLRQETAVPKSRPMP